MTFYTYLTHIMSQTRNMVFFIFFLNQRHYRTIDASVRRHLSYKKLFNPQEQDKSSDVE